ncbi:hypothetical protein BIW11_02174 [Tropilaelaps mercedesae]|uniref:Uncharacterized protein n=1 Tax=Tropilaelaps mercedesae TaxID=418985 RepID=A0A1V9X2E5_9ACAR|nr:hypothetical protein BIW11_02174 [Tropilaelaps mercedesae]
MRLLSVLLACFVATAVTAQLAGIGGAVKGITALSGSVAKLSGLPVATVGPVRLSLSTLLALKALGLLKMKLVKVPLLAPVGVATAKFGLLKAKYSLGKTAIVTIGKTKLGLIHLPVKLTAAKLGAIVGGISGAKAGLAAYKVHPKKHSLEPLLLPATTFISELKALMSNFQIPTKNVTIEVEHVPYVIVQHELEESEKPFYGHWPTTTTTSRPAPAYITAASAYTPAPPALSPVYS